MKSAKISKTNISKELSESKTQHSNLSEPILKKKIRNFSMKKLFYKKNLEKKCKKKELNIDVTSEINKDTNPNTINDTNYNTNVTNSFHLNETQKNQRLKQLIEKISDNKLKKEILDIYKDANPYSKNEPPIKRYSKLKNVLNTSYNNRKVWKNSMKISNQSNITYCPNLSQSQNYSPMKKGISLRKKISLKSSNLSTCTTVMTPIKKLHLNLFDIKRSYNDNNNLIVKNVLLSNLLNEKIYYQCDAKKLMDVNYFLINVKKSEYETEIKTHDILCLISDKYLTTIDKIENSCIPKKVIEIKAIKKLNIISIGLKKNISNKYVVIIVGYCYSDEIKEIIEIQEGLLIEKKKDVDDMVEVLSKLINDLEILYL